MLAVLVAAIAFAAASEIRTFGPAGQGDGRLGPHTAGLAVTADGDVLVADRKQGRVEVFANDGRPLDAWGDFDDPSALAVDGDRVLVGDVTGVRAYALDGRLLQVLGGPRSPGGIAVAPGGAVYASDTAGGRVQRLGGPAIGTGELTAPVGVAVGRDGDLYVADAAGEAVKRFSPSGVLERSYAVEDPHGVAVGGDGTLYAAASSHRIVRFGADGARLADVGADGSLNVPRGVALDCRGALYVVDNSNPRVHVFAEPGTAAPPCPPPPRIMATPTPEPPPPTPTPTPTPTPEPEPEPEVGRTTRATVLSGVVLVGTGSSTRQLGPRQMLPIGQRIDATNGAVKLEFEAIGGDRAAYGRLMDADFEAGAFTAMQARDDSLVEIVLDEPAGVAARRGTARAAQARRRSRVWTRARGRFRTRGAHGAATVRGTRWLTSERARGTFFRVSEGSVQVEDFTTGRTQVLGAGQSYIARAPCYSRRRFAIRLRPPAGTEVVDVVVRMDGRRLPVRRGARLTAVVDLRGRPKGVMTVAIRVRTADGEVRRGVRRYHTCQKGRSRAGVPEL